MLKQLYSWPGPELKAIAVLLVLSFSGCCTQTAVKFGNGTSMPIRVQTTHTGREVAIKPGRFKKIPHGSGDLVVTHGAGEKLRFAAVETLGLGPNYVATGRCFPPYEAAVRMRLETNQMLYVLLPGKTRVDLSAEQPAGYPKTAQGIAPQLIRGFDSTAASGSPDLRP